MVQSPQNLRYPRSANAQIPGQSSPAFDDSVVEKRLIESGTNQRIVLSLRTFDRLECCFQVAPGQEMDVPLLSGSRYEAKT